MEQDESYLPPVSSLSSMDSKIISPKNQKTTELDISLHQKTNVIELFTQNYSNNKSAVEALKSVVTKPPISDDRDLPADTEELLERAKIILRLRQAACSKHWTRESVLKEIEARKNLSKNLKNESTEPLTPVNKSPRPPRIVPRDNNNFSIKKRRQSYLRTPSVQEEIDEEMSSSFGSELPLLEEVDENNENDKNDKSDKNKEKDIENENENEKEKEKSKSIEIEDSVESLVELWFNTYVFILFFY